MDPFVAEVRIFAGNFPPRGWASCDGQLLPISQNTALFSLLGTTYGGDGRSTFALPDLAGSAPMQQGNGPGLTPRMLGEMSGSPSVTLIVTEMPAHTHTVMTANDSADTNQSTGNALARSTGASVYGPKVGGSANTAPQNIGLTGQSQPHNNMQPFLSLYFIIALQGIFPQRG